MNLTVLLADAAQADTNGKVGALGLGWSLTGVPLAAHSIVVLFEVAWHESNEQHGFTVELLDEDGSPVLADNGNPIIRVDGGIEMGRPAGLLQGTPLIQPWVLNLPPGMPLKPGRRYEYRVTVDDGAMGSVSFSTVAEVGRA